MTMVDVLLLVVIGLAAVWKGLDVMKVWLVATLGVLAACGGAEHDAGELEHDAGELEHDACELEHDAGELDDDACVLPEFDPSGADIFGLVSGDCPVSLTYSELYDHCVSASDHAVEGCAIRSQWRGCVTAEGLRFTADSSIEGNTWTVQLRPEVGGLCVYARRLP